MPDKESLRKELESTLAGRPWILRTDKDRRSFDGCSENVMANLDSKGLGPKESIRIQRKRAYITASYIDWVIGRIREV